jgi:hypothetical protein
MTRKQYIQFAADLRRDLSLAETFDERMLFEQLLSTICVNLSADNPRFDVEKFLTAVYGE